MLKRFAGALLALGLSAGAALALDPEERLEDPALEAKARAVTKLLRCVVCDNASVDDSNAQIAKNMRALVRKRVAEGKSADEIKAEFVEYYGEYVLLQPQFSLSNALIWGATPLALLLGLIWVGRRFSSAEGGAAAPDQGVRPQEADLSEAEKKRLEALLKD